MKISCSDRDLTYFELADNDGNSITVSAAEFIEALSKCTLIDIVPRKSLEEAFDYPKKAEPVLLRKFVCDFGHDGYIDDPEISLYSISDGLAQKYILVNGGSDTNNAPKLSKAQLELISDVSKSSAKALRLDVSNCTVLYTENFIELEYEIRDKIDSSIVTKYFVHVTRSVLTEIIDYISTIEDKTK
jgi:hypothetical protein